MTGIDRRARHPGRCAACAEPRDEHCPSENPAELDRTDPEGEIAARADGYRNWGRWGDGRRARHPQLHRRREAPRSRRPRHATGRVVLAVAVVRHRRTAEGLAPPHQPGAHDDRHRRRCRARQPGLPARHRRRRRRDRDAAAVLDPVGRPRPHLRPRHGVERPPRRRRRHERGRPRHGHRARGSTSSSRAGVLLDVGRHLAPETGELDDGYAITAADLDATASRRRARPARVGRGDIVLVRTGQLARARRDGWGELRGRAGARACRFTTAGWLHAREIAAIATDTWGFEVRPNEFDVPAFQPLHQVVIPNMGLTIGEMWDLDELADATAPSAAAATSCSPPRRCRSPARSAPPSTPSRSSRPRTTQEQRGSPMTAVQRVAIAGAASPAWPPPSSSPRPASRSTSSRRSPSSARSARASRCRATPCAVFDALGVVGARSATQGYAFEGLHAARSRARAPRSSPTCPTSRPAAPTTPPPWGCTAPTSRASCSTAPPALGATRALRRERHRPRRRPTTASTSLVNGESAGDYDLLVGADGLNSTVRALIGIETRPEPTGMGIWRAFVLAAGRGRAHRALLRRPGVHRGLHARRATTRCTRSSSRRRRTAPALTDEEAARHHARASRAPTADRGTQIRADLEAGAPRQLHLVHPHIDRRPVEPRARRRHRRCRAQLPAHDRAGRGPGARRRARAERPPRRARTRSTRRCGTSSTPAASARDRRSSRRPCSSASGRSTATATRTPAA